MEKEMATHPSTRAWNIPWTDREAWWATVHGVAKNWTRLGNFTSLHFILSVTCQLPMEQAGIGSELSGT